MSWHAFDKLFLMVTIGSRDLCLYFWAAVYTQYVHVWMGIKYKCAVDEFIGFGKHNYQEK